jgi:hypothetical protein
LPSSWAGVWSTTAMSLSASNSGAATLTMTSPVGTPDGSYGIGVRATNVSSSSYSGSATATYLISRPGPLTTSVTTNQSSYLPGQTVGVIVTMLYGTVPDAAASVTVVVTAPSGKSTTLNGTTGGSGVALLNYKLSRHAAAGTYQVQLGPTVSPASSTMNGASATASASTSFFVQ